MGNAALFGVGIFITLLFLMGILFTVREFRNMEKERQKSYKHNAKNMQIESDPD